MMRKLYDWFTLADYAIAKAHATDQVVKRYTRGNVSVQNGWYLNEEDLADLSKRGDRAVARLKKKISPRAA